MNTYRNFFFSLGELFICDVYAALPPHLIRHISNDKIRCLHIIYISLPEGKTISGAPGKYKNYIAPHELFTLNHVDFSVRGASGVVLWAETDVAQDPQRRLSL